MNKCPSDDWPEYEQENDCPECGEALHYEKDNTGTKPDYLNGWFCPECGWEQP